MAALDWEDLGLFLDEEEFASPVTLTRSDGSVLEFPAIFENPYLDAQTGEYNMDMARPRAWCAHSDVPGVQRGDACVIDGIRYDVLTRPQGDGSGMAMLDLAEAPDA
jgi:hypothetical protein